MHWKQIKSLIKKIPKVSWCYQKFLSIILSVKKKYRFYCEFIKYKKLSQNKNKGNKLHWSDRYPCLNDWTATTGFDSHYIYHPAWAARILSEQKPEKHISSSLAFVSIVSAFIPVDFYDYRPASLQLDKLHSKKADLLNLPFEDKSIHSLSCMHVVEHIGLGRYGDPLDPSGDFKAVQELKRVLAVNGNLLFVVPIGKPKTMFNAHRIYSYDQVIDSFSGFKLLEFSLVPDLHLEYGFIKNAKREIANKQKYGCGCFWFRRIQ